MRLFDEFKAFIQRGNVIDLAVAVVMGAAFGKIVSSLVSDLAMPLIGIATNSVNLAERKYTLHNPLNQEEVWAILKWGSFVQASIDFVIISICVFLAVKAVNTIYRSPPPKPPESTPQEKLLMEIRDLLKANQTPPANPAPPPIP